MKRIAVRRRRAVDVATLFSVSTQISNEAGVTSPPMALRWKLCLAFLVGLLAVIPAESAGPARNGVIVYAGAVVENVNPEIYAFPLAGGPLQNVIVFPRDGREWVLAASDGSGQRALPRLDYNVGWAPETHDASSARF